MHVKRAMVFAHGVYMVCMLSSQGDFGEYVLWWVGFILSLYNSAQALPDMNSCKLHVPYICSNF